MEDDLSKESLLNCNWKQLRSEIVEWNAEDVDGYDGSTRFWCREAIFDIYWVAERAEGEEKRYEVYLTEDLELTGFKASLPFRVNLDWKISLAEHLNWRGAVVQVLKNSKDTQLDMFEI